MGNVTLDIKLEPLHQRAAAAWRIKSCKHGFTIPWIMNYIEEWEKITEELKEYDRKRTEKNHA